MRKTIAAAALLFAATSAFADRHVVHKFDSTAPAAGVRRVVIEIPAGEVTIRNGSAKELRIFGHVEREYDGWRRAEENQKIVDDISAEIRVSNEEAVVRRRFGPNAHGWRGSHSNEFHITIEVPAGVSLDFETSYGEVNIDGAFGDVMIDLRAGEINLRTPRANVRELNASCRVGEVRTNLGHEIIEREGIFPRTTHWSKETGSSRLDVHVTAGEVNITLTQ